MLVEAVQHPALGAAHHLFDLPAKVFVARLGPAGQVNERIELGVRNAELRGHALGQGRLPVAAHAGDDDAARCQLTRYRG